MWLPSLVQAASFTPDARVKWPEIISLCDTHHLTPHLNLHASNFNELFPTDLVLNELIQIHQDANLGKLLNDLSPERFDWIVSNNLDIEVDEDAPRGTRPKFPAILDGYLNEASLWRKAYTLPEHTPLTSDNVVYNLLEHSMEEYCSFMREVSGGRFISRIHLRHCCEIWNLEGDYRAIRQATLNSFILAGYKCIAEAFHGHEQDYMNYLTECIRMDRLVNQLICLPDSFPIEQLKYLSRQGCKLQSPNSSLRISNGSAMGMDAEPFDGKFTLPLFLDHWYLRTCPLASTILHSRPVDKVETAVDALYFFGDPRPLSNYQLQDEDLERIANHLLLRTFPIDVDRYGQIIEVLMEKTDHDFQKWEHEWNFNLKPHDSACEMALRSYLEKCHASMALTANYKLLTGFLNVFHPDALLRTCQLNMVRNHMKLMLHLNPQVRSYEYRDKQRLYVSKLSPRFRNWVLHHLEYYAHPEACKKLAWYYFDNILNFRYPEYECFFLYGLGSPAESRIEGTLEFDK